MLYDVLMWNEKGEEIQNVTHNRLAVRIHKDKFVFYQDESSLCVVYQGWVQMNCLELFIERMSNSTFTGEEGVVGVVLNLETQEKFMGISKQGKLTEKHLQAGWLLMQALLEDQELPQYKGEFSKG